MLKVSETFFRGFSTIDACIFAIFAFPSGDERQPLDPHCTTSVIFNIPLFPAYASLLPSLMASPSPDLPPLPPAVLNSECSLKLTTPLPPRLSPTSYPRRWARLHFPAALNLPPVPVVVPAFTSSRCAKLRARAEGHCTLTL